MRLLIIISLTLLSTIYGRPYSENNSPKCGYESCPNPIPGFLNLHLVPHSHDDVGWLKTVDQYYYGRNTTIQQAGVQYILDSVVNELFEDSNRKFIYVETAFLWKWWQEQSTSQQEQIKKLINNGQLEIIGGGWSMNDEATTHYHSVLDQFTWGFRRLNDTFGECARPKIGWQIDPFGHSRELASMMAQFGFDGLFFARLDWRDKTKRMGNKTAEMLWHGSPNLGKSSDLFTSALFNHYSAPPGFCFDILCQDDPIIDDNRSSEFNVDEKVKEFIQFAQKQAKSYKTNNIIITMGDDFNYQVAEIYFKNLDKLIYNINKKQEAGSKVNAFYSTPSCYIKALNEAKEVWPSKTDDFFPYATDPHAYWTGYYSSRPTIKFMEREGNNVLQACKQMSVLSNLGDSSELVNLREVMGVMQHHDAITGTEKQHVSDDYARMLAKAIEECSAVIKTGLSRLLKPENLNAPEIKLQQCALNISQCEVSENSKAFSVIIYNPSSQKLDKYVRIPVVGTQYVIQNSKGDLIASQIIPIPKSIQNIPGRNSLAKNDLIFLANNIPPLGYKTFFIKVSQKKPTSHVSKDEESNMINNSKITLTLDKTGQITHLKTVEQDLPFRQEFLYYEGATGNNEVFENRSSGAYIFRPIGTAYNLNQTSSKVYKGPLVDELHTTLTSWISSVTRLYKDAKHIEFEWLVGPIPIADEIGKEIITRFRTNLATKGSFYTDSNGRELLNRTRNYRETWEVDIEEPVAGNYYPVTSRIVLSDSNTRLAVINDRAQGGSSLKDGEVELMLHRRLLHDDAFGVGESLNESAYGGQGLVARGTNYVLVGGSKTSPTAEAEERKFASQNILSPILYFAEVKNFETYNKLRKEYEGLSEEIPANVQILTLEPWKNNSVLLRLEHIMESQDDPILSKKACINVEDLFTGKTITKLAETTLGGNQWLGERQRLQWNSTGESKEQNTEFMSHGIDTNNMEQINSNFGAECVGENKQLEVILSPMQIRTFIVNFKQN